MSEEGAPPNISAVIVTYQSDIIALKKAVNSLKFCGMPIDISIVDNHSGANYLARLSQSGLGVRVINSGLNKGFGAGHNLGFALRNGPSNYHLVVNPDVIVPQGAMAALIDFMEKNKNIGVATPKIINERGDLQYLCKRKPSIMALFGRRFMPQKLANTLLKGALERYTMRDQDYNKILEPEFLSGCFMCFRSEVFEKLEGFDERFFLYFEDADITMRAKQITKAVHFPGTTIIHAWQGGARTSRKLTRMMMVSAIRFFNKWGWKWW